MQERKENDMSAHDQLKQNTSDPLGLSDLEAIEPGYDGWAHIESALQAHQNNKRNWQRAGGWLAVAASLVLVISISLRNTENDAIIISISLRNTENDAINSLPSPEFATPATNLASVPVQDNINALIGLSQNMESQVKRLREETASMPAESAIYVAELEDLIAQVDNELSLTPDSIDLWGQRVNLMLDLAQIYQQQWQIDYGRMASL
jgi:hypothetical protein